MHQVVSFGHDDLDLAVEVHLPLPWLLLLVCLLDGSDWNGMELAGSGLGGASTFSALTSSWLTSMLSELALLVGFWMILSHSPSASTSPGIMAMSLVVSTSSSLKTTLCSTVTDRLCGQ